MRLIHARTLTLVEFFNNPQIIPKYAILSHTWGSNEVSYEDMIGGNAQSKAGYQKILYACLQASRDGYKFVWIDTCCIQKSSSSELSEAINSMFEWYRKSSICYAYLEGITSKEMENCSLSGKDDADYETFHSEQFSRKPKFTQHRWFTRGWTLQELIAPPRVQFYGKNWQTLGSSLDHLEAITLRTGIDPKVLAAEPSVKFEVLKNFSVAQRMSWGADRLTTRIEDESYCMLGLFGVNMPLLYGEGHAAFIRLQEEIMKVSSDQTILAWNSGAAQATQLLAPTISCFRQCGTLVGLPLEEVPEPFAMTNVGLRIRVHLIDLGGPYLAVLTCRYTDEPWGPVGLILYDVGRQTGEVPTLYIGNNHVRRHRGISVHSDGNRTVSIENDVADLQLDVKKQEIIVVREGPTNLHRISTTMPGSGMLSPDQSAKFFIPEHFGARWSGHAWRPFVSIKSLYPSMQWRKTHSTQDSERKCLLSLPSHALIGAICIDYKDNSFLMTFGLNGKNFQLEVADAWIHLKECSGNLNIQDIMQEIRVSHQAQGPYSRKHPSKFTLYPKQFKDERIEVSLTRKRSCGDVIFVVNCKVDKLKAAHNTEPFRAAVEGYIPLRKQIQYGNTC